MREQQTGFYPELSSLWSDVPRAASRRHTAEDGSGRHRPGFGRRENGEAAEGSCPPFASSQPVPSHRVAV